MRIYATEQLGPTQSLTPEGYLLCEGVPIARTGTQLYAAHELPFLEAGVDGLITVIREEADVFRPETIASFEGKSVTIRHSFVDPDNWGEVTKGTVQNVRRCPFESDLLLADLLITDAEAIDKVKTKVDDDGRVTELPELREVSCGYDADYEQDRPGVAYQRNIVGNHVALVERGRAGPRCSIQDEEPETMTTKATKAPALLQRLIKAIRSKDAALIGRTADEAEAEVEAEEKRAADEETAEKLRAKDEELAALKKTVDELTAQLSSAGKIGDEDDLDESGNPKPKTGDEEPTDEEKKKTADAMAVVLSRAEILVPGFAMPTTDSVPNLAGVVAVQRKVLAGALKTTDGKEALEPLLAGRTVDALPAEAVQTVFVAASEVMRVKNNARGIVRGVQVRDSAARPLVSNAEINKRNAEFWKTN